MITAGEIEHKLYDWAPKELAYEWDNVGLLVGDSAQEVRRVLVALDITQAVAEEAVRLGAQLIVAHHPVMNCTWHPVQTLREDDAQGKLLRTLVRNDISAICMHTNLDIAEGGVNDCLAEKLGLSDILPLGEDKIGRIGTLSCELPLEQFLQVVVKSLSSNGLRYIDGGKAVKKVAVGGGACRDYIPQAIALGCDTFVTSDLKYNDFLDTAGLNLVDAGHFPTENVVLPAMVSYLQTAFPALEIVRSASHDREVIQYYT
ncbi:MAG: Nif3-like dinuclear metal center hexameric protein [Oscillospiraceae bacterium]|nr:Nif3-like dinuclear metal center hexameric protein [Oscillospiraceae bacterium]